VMLQLCALPVTALAFFLGGVSPGQVVGTFLLLLAVSAVFGAAGLYVSSDRLRTAPAIIGSYFLALAAFFIGPICALCGSALHDVGDIGILGIFVVGMIVLIGYFVAMGFAAISTMVSRRPVNRVTFLAGYGALGCLVGLVLSAAQSDSSSQAFTIVLSPIGALTQLLVGDIGYLGGSASRGWESTIVPVTIVLLLLQAWVFIVLAAGEVERMRPPA
jgi:hypothetical protein